MKTIFIAILFVAGCISYGQNDSGELRASTLPNLIAFDYDTAGNQILRRYIHVNSGVYKETPRSNETATSQLLDSDIYEDIKYFPNPVVSELYVKWKNVGGNYVRSMELYAMSGQSVKSYTFSDGKEEAVIDFQNFPLGFYNLILTYSTGEQKNLRIIKK